MRRLIVKLPLLVCLASPVIITASCDYGKGSIPDAPANLWMGAVTSDGAIIAWESNNHAGNHVVEINGSTTYSVRGTSHVVSGLAPSSRHTWRVRAVNGAHQSEWIEGPAFTTGPPETGDAPAVSVNFGEGGELWQAAYAKANYFSSFQVMEIFVCVPEDTVSDFVPCVWMSVHDEGDTSFPEAASLGLYFEYFSADYWKERNRWSSSAGHIPDWKPRAATVTILSMADGKVSGVAKALMYDAWKTCPDKTLTVAFRNIPITGVKGMGSLGSAKSDYSLGH